MSLATQPAKWFWRRSLVVFFLLVFASLAVTSALEKSPAFDELFHVTGGYSYWIANDFRIHPTNGNLIQRWLALPLLVSHPQFPSRDQENWRRPSYFGFNLAREFAYDVGNDPAWLLAQARGMVVLLSVLLGFFVYRWSRRLFGPRGGLVSLVLYSFCPTILAHGQLATSDLAAALFFSVAVYGIWQCLHHLSAATLLASALATAILFVIKFSALLLLPMAALMLALRLARKRGLPVWVFGNQLRIEGRLKQALLFSLVAVFHAAVTVVLIWACYGFRFSAFADGKPGEFGEPWPVALESKSPLMPALKLAVDRWFLPEAFLYGLAHTLRFSEARPAYLRGECRLTGWWYYFPYCFAVKTPLSVFAMLLLAAVAVHSRGKRQFLAKVEISTEPGPRRGFLRAVAPRLYRTAPLWILLCVYWFAAISSQLNLGVRHLLPTYPPLFILAGAAGWWLRRPLSKAGLLCLAVLGFHAVECLRMYPNYLAYFNQFVGGPRQGYRHLVDSNLDWGQDLPGLAHWLERNGLNNQSQHPVYYSYLGVGKPEAYGIRAASLSEYLSTNISLRYPFPLRGGVYCISATIIAGCNEPIPRWTRQVDNAYLATLDRAQEIIAEKAPEKPPEWQEVRQALSFLEYARLLAYLRGRRPDDMINYSILVYRLTDDDLAEAMMEPAPGAARLALIVGKPDNSCLPEVHYY